MLWEWDLGMGHCEAWEWGSGGGERPGEGCVGLQMHCMPCWLCIGTEPPPPPPP